MGVGRKAVENDVPNATDLAGRGGGGGERFSNGESEQRILNGYIIAVLQTGQQVDRTAPYHLRETHILFIIIINIFHYNNLNGPLNNNTYISSLLISTDLIAVEEMRSLRVEHEGHTAVEEIAPAARHFGTAGILTAGGETRERAW
jgi:hypothetical protein